MVNYLKEITNLEPYINTEPFCALRVNPLRMTKEQFEAAFPYELSECKFWKYGYYISNEDKTGLHPLHYAGAYYIQEPSAMSAITALDIKPEDKVLDCCAAPGSKATAIAALCKILVANEINPSRAKALLGNIERMGISNALVLNTDTQNLPLDFSGYFDKVLVDSPCSGEGMFRKHPDILENWTPELVKMCAARSKQVLANAAACVKEGGRLVYSTCTYNLEENEKLIIDFLEQNPDFEICDTNLNFGKQGFLGLEKARRIFIEDGGEGHFICAMTRVCCNKESYPKPFRLTKKFEFLQGITTSLPRFTSDQSFGVLDFQGVKYAVPEIMPQPKKSRILRVGVKLGEVSGKLFKPDHHLFMALDTDSFYQKFEPENIQEFLQGQEIDAPSDIKGYCAITYKGLPVGFGKASGGKLKNHLPKGLRI